jgi:hypothetical protein
MVVEDVVAGEATELWRFEGAVTQGQRGSLRLEGSLHQRRFLIDPVQS